MIEAVDYLHNKIGVAHLDLKLENILIGSDMKLKLCDFGFVQDHAQRIHVAMGTDGYKAPEIYRCYTKGFSGVQADIFALGVLLFIMLFGVPPFTHATEENGLYRFFCKGPSYVRFFFKSHPATKEDFMKGKIEQETIDLFASLLSFDAELRPKDVRDIKNFSFIQASNLS